MKKRNGILRIRTKGTGGQWEILIIFYLLLFQSALETVHPVFRYVDELTALIGICFVGYQAFLTKHIRFKKRSGAMILCLIPFLISGLLGNFLFHYQPIQYVLTDLFTNMKFYLCIVSGFVIFRNCSEKTKMLLSGHASFAAVIFFVMLIVDQFLHIFPTMEMRYGIRVAQLTHKHPTYLAGSMIFLISVLTAFYQEKNIPYIIMSLVICFFTLRGKAIAGCAVYVMLCYFILVGKKKIKIWHLIIIGIAVILIAWDLLSFYYLELDGQSARSILTKTSFEIMKDYFPIGTGFGTYASSSAAEHYSPVYVKYGFLQVYELGGNETGWGFYSDTFWPIIIGQNGCIGIISYILLQILLFRRIQLIRNNSVYAYIAGLFIFAYVIISSTSEPAFNNSVTAPLAVLLGHFFSLENQKTKEEFF